MDERGCNCGIVCLGITQLIFAAAFGVGYVWSFISGLITMSCILTPIYTPFVITVVIVLFEKVLY